MAFFLGPLQTTLSPLFLSRKPMLMHASLCSVASTYWHPSVSDAPPARQGQARMRGIEGPVRSTSSMPTFGLAPDGEDSGGKECRKRASWVLTDDFPTPPLPASTMMMCLTCFIRFSTAPSTADIDTAIVPSLTLQTPDRAGRFELVYITAIEKP